MEVLYIFWSAIQVSKGILAEINFKFFGDIIVGLYSGIVDSACLWRKCIGRSIFDSSKVRFS